MGACQSRADGLRVAGDNAAAGSRGGKLKFNKTIRGGLHNGFDGDDKCPTVFELERSICEQRRRSKSIHTNVAHIEFRRGLFEVYTRGDDLEMEAFCGGIVKPEARAGLGSARHIAMFEATHKATGRMYAVREFEIPVDRSAREVNKMWAEFDAHAVLDHPNISRLQEVFCSEERYHVVTDLLSGGDMMSRLAEEGRNSYEEPEAVKLVKKIVGAIRHCHSESVVHRNLRMKSCLFENDSPWADLKIVDAAATPAPRAEGGIATAPSSTGSSRSIVRTDISGSWRSRTGKPTTWYMPPEVRTGQACSERGDMWMVGVLAWLILAGPFPQAGMSQEAAWSSIMVGKPAFKGSGWANRSLEAADFVSQLIQKDPEQRLTAAEALEHPWLKAKGTRADDDLPPQICASLLAFKDSTVIRRLGLQLVGRTLEASKLLPATEAFRLLDRDGKGYIVGDDLVKGMHASAFLSTTARNGLNTAGDDEKVTDQHHGDSTIKGEESALGRRPASSSASRPRDDQSTEARDVFRAMDLEGSGRVGFSAFLAACLAGKPADEAASRVAFGWLDKRQRGAINGSDLQLFTGEVLSPREIEDAFADAHDTLDIMSIQNAGPIGATVRETEARKSAASGAVGGLIYAEFHRLLSAVPSPGNAEYGNTVHSAIVAAVPAATAVAESEAGGNAKVKSALPGEPLTRVADRPGVDTGFDGAVAVGTVSERHQARHEQR